MSAAAVLAAAREVGVSVRIEGAELKVKGPPAALVQWVPELRAVKADLMLLLSEPPAALAQPGPEPPPAPLQATDETLPVPALAYDSAPESVTCPTCLHFTPNRSTPEAGYGLCAAPPTVRRPPYSGWPLAQHRCPGWVAKPPADARTVVATHPVAADQPEGEPDTAVLIGEVMPRQARVPDAVRAICDGLEAQLVGREWTP